MVRDSAFYDILGIDVEASSNEIRYAYYQKATEAHPDKNPGDPKAAEDFVALADAFQVLMDPEKRGWYNKHGKLCIPQDYWLHSYTVYGMVFGSESFKEYIGEFALTTFSTFLDMEEETEDPEVRKKIAWEKTLALLKERHEKLTKIMIDRIQPFVDGHMDEFEKSIDSEARRLSSAAFGECLLYTIGIIYIAKASKELKGKEEVERARWIKVKGPRGFELRSQIHAARGKNRQQLRGFEFGNSSIIVETGQRTTGRMSESERTAGRLDRPNMSQADREEDLRQNIFNYLDFWRIDSKWSANVIDIETSASYICKAILKDSTVSKEVLKLRAEALDKLGKIFKGTSPAYHREYSICLEDGQEIENEDSDFSD